MTTRANRTMTIREWSLLLALSLLWGGSFFFVGVAVKELPTFTVVVARVALAACLLWSVIWLTRAPIRLDPSIWGAFFGMGLLNNAIPFTLIAWGQSHIASGVASILNAVTPLFTIIIAHALTSDEKMTGSRLAGVLLGLAGVAVLIGGEAVRSLGLNVLAQLACLGAAISYGFASVFGRRFKALAISPIAAAAGQVTTSSLMLAPVALFVERPWTLPAPSWGAILALVGLAALSTALAYILFFRLLASAGATNVGIVTLLIPVSAILLGALFLGETLHPKHSVGMALIGLGLAAIDGRPLAALKRRLGSQPPSG
jgi:drug/metabolite transporter (DMT)-like permease